MTREDRQRPGEPSVKHFSMGECMDRVPTVPQYQVYVGVDIAAASFDASWLHPQRRPSAAHTYPQSAAGFAAFQQQLQATGAAPDRILVVLEATGSYWAALAVSLHQAGYAVAIANPAQVHNYAKSLPR